VEERRFSAASRRDKKSGLQPPHEDNSIRTFNLCFLGFGNVNRTLVRLLEDRAGELRDQYGIPYRITGVASRRLGWIADPNGLDPETCGAGAPARDQNQCGAGTPARDQPRIATGKITTAPNATNHREGHDFSRANSKANPQSALAAEVGSWLNKAHADILFEATSLDVADGQPAVDHIRAALHHGAHAISANKGPIVHAYRELRDLARARGKKFLFESTVMDGVPIFSLFDQLPAIHLHGFHGILNSTTNVILAEMENGLTFDGALAKAQSLGVAETDASHDIDGWDAAVKTAALITVLMDIPIKLADIRRDGIRDLTAQAVRNARRDGWPFKLVCRARRKTSIDSSGVAVHSLEASVAPEKVLASSPMGKIAGTSSYIYFETDIFPGLALTEENPGLYATAYGMLADFIRAVK
jgi:homoserine dehydrogenase